MSNEVPQRGQLRGNDAIDYIYGYNAKVTFQNINSGNRFTYRIRAPKDHVGPDAPAIFFVSVLTGPDNEGDYQYIGFIRHGNFEWGKKSRITIDAPSVAVFYWVWHRLTSSTLPDFIQVWHEGTCGCCGRALTTPESIERGFGPICFARDREGV